MVSMVSTLQDVKLEITKLRPQSMALQSSSMLMNAKGILLADENGLQILIMTKKSHDHECVSFRNDSLLSRGPSEHISDVT